MTPRDRRQADKERYQTYTLNANDVVTPISYEVLLENDQANGHAPECPNQTSQDDVKENKVQQFQSW